MILLTVGTLFADCELVKNSKALSYDRFIEAQTLFENGKYNESYEKLLESFKTYDSSSDEIELDYSCINYVPGPYAPILKKSSKTESFDFGRENLGIDIKHKLNPAPYIFVEFEKDKTVVMVTNSVKTSYDEISKRLPLDDFTVYVGNDKIEFGRVEVATVKKKSVNHIHSIDDVIKATEKFGFAPPSTDGINFK